MTALFFTKARLPARWLRALACLGAVLLTACAKRTDLPKPGQPWTNPDGLRFVPVEGTSVLFAVTETPASLFERFVAEANLAWIAPDGEHGAGYPAGNVTWDNAVAFCQWLTQRDRTARLLGPQQQYRLPTDAEWSLAAGLGVESPGTPAEKSQNESARYVWAGAWPPPKGAGNFAGEEAEVDKTEPDLFVAGYDDGFPRIAPVEKFTPNRFGLHDLAGNVMEWCDDWFDASHRGRVARGGSFLSGDARTLAATHRAEVPPRAGLDVVGFRSVLDLGRSP
jgi:formylglycine-generating enzyme required for sulfatase activity